MKRYFIPIFLAMTSGATLADAVERGASPGRNPHDALLAALGTATLECLGTLGPSIYTTQGGVLARVFDSCPSGDRSALAQVDALLGAQLSEAGRRDDLAGHYVGTWDAFVAGFPWRRIRSCPAWDRTQAIEAPTFESVPRHIGRVAVATFRYRVASDQCGRNLPCAVSHAQACSKGFGPEFVVELNPRSGQIVVDPVWWLTHYQYPTQSSNPFMVPGYYHAMSYYGDLPGASFGALQRAGEACSEYLDGKHYTDRTLVPIDCGGGWYCMTYCMLAPSPASATGVVP